MKILSIEISNFRSIRRKIKITEKSSRLFTLVGANNLGKSNILRAINLFFSKQVEPDLLFNPTTDISQGAKRAVISITLQFTRIEDARMIAYIDKKHHGEFSNYTIAMTLMCQTNGTLQYTFSGAKGQRRSFPDLVLRIQEYVNCIYIPAIKDYSRVIDAQMMKKIVGATFQGWGRGRYGSKTIGEQKAKFANLLKEVQTVLDESGDYVSGIISSVVPSIENFAFLLPYGHLEDFLGRLIFTIKEKHLTESITLGGVGSGIQSFAIFSMLRLLHEIRPTNTHKKAWFLWLIEEPETFMHHDLQRKTHAKLKEYSKDGHIFITTHSPVFIDKQNFGSTYVVTHDGASTQLEFITSKNLKSIIAGNLGVAFDDFFDFMRFNILVEGESDKTLLTELNKLFMQADSEPLLNLEHTGFLVCGSASAIPHIYHQYNLFNRFSDFVALFDRDDPGVKARTDLINRGIDEARLILIPKSINREKNTIEDLVDRSVWEKVIKQLDSDGLVEVKAKQQVITGYEYHFNDRVAVKKTFVKYLLQHARKDLSAFAIYRKLLGSMEAILGTHSA
jgi:predicted ATP-dependent endonuclease of OLD family